MSLFDSSIIKQSDALTASVGLWSYTFRGDTVVSMHIEVRQDNSPQLSLISNPLCGRKLCHGQQGHFDRTTVAGNWWYGIIDVFFKRFPFSDKPLNSSRVVQSKTKCEINHPFVKGISKPNLSIIALWVYRLIRRCFYPKRPLYNHRLINFSVIKPITDSFVWTTESMFELRPSSWCSMAQSFLSFVKEYMDASTIVRLKGCAARARDFL